MKVNNIKRLTKDDFDKEYQQLIDRLSFSLTPFMEQVVSAFNKNVDFDNLNQEFIILDTQVDAQGRPTMNSEIKNPLRTRVRGIQCVNAQNMTDNTLLTGGITVVFVVESNLIKISQITGLPTGKRFNLSIILIG